MHNVYDDTSYAQIKEDMDKKLIEVKAKYGDNEALSKKYLADYLEAKAKKQKH